MNTHITPLTVVLDKSFQLISVYSITDSIGLDITGCEYADLISLEAIANSVPSNVDKVNIIRESIFMNTIRETIDNIGVLILYIHCDNVVLIVDNDREVEVKIE